MSMTPNILPDYRIRSTNKAAISPLEVSDILNHLGQNLVPMLQMYTNNRAQGIDKIKQRIMQTFDDILVQIHAEFIRRSKLTNSSPKSKQIFGKAAYLFGEFLDYLNEDSPLKPDDDDEIFEKVAIFLEVARDKLSAQARHLAEEAELYKQRRQQKA